MNSGGSIQNQAGEKPNSDFPPFSRVFVVCSRNHKEEDIREAFQTFGNLEDVWMVKDRMTKENKGICYVKFDKASTAALAIETLDGKTIGNEAKPIKVWLCVCACVLQSTIACNWSCQVKGHGQGELTDTIPQHKETTEMYP